MDTETQHSDTQQPKDKLSDIAFVFWLCVAVWLVNIFPKDLSKQKINSGSGSFVWSREVFWEYICLSFCYPLPVSIHDCCFGSVAKRGPKQQSCIEAKAINNQPYNLWGPFFHSPKDYMVGCPSAR